MLASVVSLRPRGLKPNRPSNAAPATVASAATSRRAAVATASVSSFLAEMIEFAGGGELQWKRVAHSYNSMRTEHGWPELQDQELSNRLVAMGCSRRRVRTSKGRLTLIGFPLGPGEPLALAG